MNPAFSSIRWARLTPNRRGSNPQRAEDGRRKVDQSDSSKGHPTNVFAGIPVENAVDEEIDIRAPTKSTAPSASSRSPPNPIGARTDNTSAPRSSAATPEWDGMPGRRGTRRSGPRGSGQGDDIDTGALQQMASRFGPMDDDEEAAARQQAIEFPGPPDSDEEDGDGEGEKWDEHEQDGAPRDVVDVVGRPGLGALPPRSGVQRSRQAPTRTQSRSLRQEKMAGEIRALSRGDASSEQSTALSSLFVDSDEEEEAEDEADETRRTMRLAERKRKRQALLLQPGSSRSAPTLPTAPALTLAPPSLPSLISSAVHGEMIAYSASVPAVTLDEDTLHRIDIISDGNEKVAAALTNATLERRKRQAEDDARVLALRMASLSIVAGQQMRSLVEAAGRVGAGTALVRESGAVQDEAALLPGTLFGATPRLSVSSSPALLGPLGAEDSAALLKAAALQVAAMPGSRDLLSHIVGHADSEHGAGIGGHSRGGRKNRVRLARQAKSGRVGVEDEDDMHALRAQAALLQASFALASASSTGHVGPSHARIDSRLEETAGLLGLDLKALQDALQAQRSRKADSVNSERGAARKARLEEQGLLSDHDEFGNAFGAFEDEVVMTSDEEDGGSGGRHTREFKGEEDEEDDDAATARAFGGDEDPDDDLFRGISIPDGVILPKIALRRRNGRVRAGALTGTARRAGDGTPFTPSVRTTGTDGMALPVTGSIRGPIPPEVAVRQAALAELRAHSELAFAQQLLVKAIVSTAIARGGFGQSSPSLPSATAISLHSAAAGPGNRQVARAGGAAGREAGRAIGVKSHAAAPALRVHGKGKGFSLESTKPAPVPLDPTEATDLAIALGYPARDAEGGAMIVRPEALEAMRKFKKMMLGHNPSVIAALRKRKAELSEALSGAPDAEAMVRLLLADVDQEDVQWGEGVEGGLQAKAAGSGSPLARVDSDHPLAGLPVRVSRVPVGFKSWGEMAEAESLKGKRGGRAKLALSSEHQARLDSVIRAPRPTAGMVDAPTPRMARMGSNIARALSDLLCDRNTVRDDGMFPAGLPIEIAEVSLTPDLRTAYVRWALPSLAKDRARSGPAAAPRLPPPSPTFTALLARAAGASAAHSTATLRAAGLSAASRGQTPSTRTGQYGYAMDGVGTSSAARLLQTALDARALRLEGHERAHRKPRRQDRFEAGVDGTGQGAQARDEEVDAVAGAGALVDQASLALERNAGALRRAVAHRLKLRFTPMLEFHRYLGPRRKQGLASASLPGE